MDFRLGFLVSGGGSNMQAILDACQSAELSAIPAVVISSNKKAYALERAAKCGIPTCSLAKSDYEDPIVADTKIRDVLLSHAVTLVVLAGYMKKVGPLVLETFPNKIINIHPALLPKFGGQGMYGEKVHQAVLDAGESESGATVHLANSEYDRGPILAQQKVPVLANDTSELLAKRVLAAEHELYVRVIKEIATGQLSL